MIYIDCGEGISYFRVVIKGKVYMTKGYIKGMPPKNYVSDTIPNEDSIEWIISEVEKAYPNLERGTF